MSERWLSVVGYESLYEVSDYGRVRRVGAASGTVPGRMLILQPDRHGYLYVALSALPRPRHSAKVHHLVADAFIRSRRDGEEIDHIDGDPGNNCPSNLEWVSRAENSARALAAGAYLRGEAHPQAKLTVAAVREIRLLWDSGGITQTTLGTRFGVARRTINGIVSRKEWAHVV